MKKLPTFINQEEFEKLFAAEKDKGYKLAMLLSFEAGLRISEIVGFKDHIKPLTAEQVTDCAIRVVGGKGNKDRIVPRPKRMNEAALKLLPIKHSRRALEWKVHKLGLDILGKDIHWHTLRHSFASHLAGAGRPIHEIQLLMGHSRMDTTGIYLHANPKAAIDGARSVF